MSISILAVEDNLINQKLIQVQLSKIDCTYCLVEDGRKALKLLKSKNFDLLILDLYMPYISGFEVAKELRESEFLSNNAFIVALTANMNKEDREKSKEAGMNLFVEKPLSKIQMDQILKSYEAYALGSV